MPAMMDSVSKTSHVLSSLLLDVAGLICPSSQFKTPNPFGIYFIGGIRQMKCLFRKLGNPIGFVSTQTVACPKSNIS